jgi:glycosyltransferase involved in cell wall biosynthesis
VNAGISVVIPAHDEGEAVARCLRALTPYGEDARLDAQPLDIVVVANGCTDDTASRARAVAASRHGVRVVEVERASKTGALNAGDGLARHPVRVYLDADMEIDADSVRRLVSHLGNGVLAASLRSRPDAAHASAAVRAYVRVWSRLPSVREGLVGNGIVALSPEGRARFGAFPDVRGDDFFLDRLFAPAEKLVVDGGGVVRTPVGVRDLVRRKARVVAGNREVRESGAVPPGERGGTGWLGVVRRDPRRAGDAVVFVALSTAARLLARRQRRSGSTGWARDDSRGGPPGAASSGGERPQAPEGVGTR